MASDHPLTRENAATKARRLLGEGRVRVLASSEREGYVSAQVRGDSAAIYGCGYEEGAWWCSCPAKGACSHMLALQLIVVLGPRETP
jgi:uncharacterized Zn finger protein